MRLVIPLALLLWSSAAQAQSAAEVRRIDSLMTTLHQRGQFNGSVLVAVAGEVVYRQAFGEADIAAHRPFSTSTPSCIGSLSKQFTAMAIMLLAEQGKLRYDDSIVRYLPELRDVAGGIAIRHLLTHTGGIPDVGDLGIDTPALTNELALRRLTTGPAIVRAPGQKYQYSNTGYLLLATIVERVA